MDDSMCITGPYEPELATNIILFLASAPGSEIRITTQPGLGVATVTRSLLDRYAGRYIEIQCGSLSFEDAMPLPVPDGAGGVRYIHPTFPDPKDFADDAVIFLHDLSWVKYDQLTHIKAFVERRQKMGARIIIVATGNG